MAVALIAPMLPVSTIARVAAEVRLQLMPRLAVTDRVHLHRLRDGVPIIGTGPELFTIVRGHAGLPSTTYAVSEVEPDGCEAWIWLNREAWPEFVRGDVPRTVSSVAHELGHVSLHAQDLVDLEHVDAETDHDCRLDREAWTFAAHLIIPDQALHRLPRLRADELGKRFGVSTAMAAKRMQEFAAGSS